MYPKNLLRAQLPRVKISLKGLLHSCKVSGATEKASHLRGTKVYVSADEEKVRTMNDSEDEREEEPGELVRMLRPRVLSWRSLPPELKKKPTPRIRDRAAEAMKAGSYRHLRRLSYLPRPPHPRDQGGVVMKISENRRSWFGFVDHLLVELYILIMFSSAFVGSQQDRDVGISDAQLSYASVERGVGVVAFRFVLLTAKISSFEEYSNSVEFPLL